MGVRSENFIFSTTVECGFEAGDFGSLFFGVTKERQLTPGALPFTFLQRINKAVFNMTLT
jgi:hypothetical protein